MTNYLSRFFSFLIDYLILFSLYLLFYFFINGFSFHENENKLLLILITFCFFSGNFTYFVLIPFFFKITPGRKIMKLKYLFTSTKKLDQFVGLLKLELFVNILPFLCLFFYATANYFNFFLAFFQYLYITFYIFAIICLFSNLFFLKTSSITEKISHIFLVKLVDLDLETVYNEKTNSKKSKFSIFSSKIKSYE
ncbi:RDD family protein [symbiont of Argiope bruennichi]|uniref:RDD family protein n=1 Tax=symbiont of Argiope bruennichi TaxID=2810479 RepID=UPI003DA643C6